MEGRLIESEAEPPVEGGRLYLVSTPIGNMGDFSFRAVRVLRGVAVILAEDTRHSRRLLDRYDIHTPVQSYHEHNEARATPAIVERLRSGEGIALISDAGTPLLSDPGSRLVQGCVAAGIPVVAVPGASALLAALVSSGLATDRFTFFGFPPRKGRERKDLVSEVARLRHPAVLYEAPGRVAETLRELADAGAGDRSAAVARELTKQFEEIRHGTVLDLAAYYEGAPPRGEVVLVIAGGAEVAVDDETVLERARALHAGGASSRDAVVALTSELGVPRNVAYRAVQQAAREER